MLAVLASSYGYSGDDPLLPLQVLAYGIVANAAFAGSALGVLFAVAIVVSGSGVLGVVFGLVMARYVGRLGLLGAAGVGMTYGLLVWIVTQFVVMAIFVPSVILFYDQYALALAHAVYGICLGLFGRAYRRI